MEELLNPSERESNQVEINESQQLRYWSDKFSVTHEELKQAVNAVGNDPGDVLEYLNNRTEDSN